jgi:glucose-1-phosphate thymidylyltransferase
MIPIAGKPIIQYVIESLAINGIRDIILVVGYQKERILDYIGEGKQFGVEVRYVYQNNQIGGANALLQAKNYTRGEFLVLPGNRLITPETIAPIVNVDKPAILTKNVENPERYGVVSVKDGYLTEIVEKPSSPSGGLINAGIYAFDNSIYDYIELELNIPDALNNMLKNGVEIKAIETDKIWLDVVYPWDILSLNAIILQNVHAIQGGFIEPGVILKGPVQVGKDTVIRSNSYIVGPVLIGKGCEIGPNVCIFPSTSIANNVVISAFTEIRNSVIGDDVHLNSGSIIQDSVIDDGCIIGPHFNAFSGEAEIRIDDEHHFVKTGAVLGKGCRIGGSVTAEAGAILGNYLEVRPMKLLSGNIPDKSLVV